MAWIGDKSSTSSSQQSTALIRPVQSALRLEPVLVLHKRRILCQLNVDFYFNIPIAIRHHPAPGRRHLRVSKISSIPYRHHLFQFARSFWIPPSTQQLQRQHRSRRQSAQRQPLNQTPPKKLQPCLHSDSALPPLISTQRPLRALSTFTSGSAGHGPSCSGTLPALWAIFTLSYCGLINYTLFKQPPCRQVSYLATRYDRPLLCNTEANGIEHPSARPSSGKSQSCQPSGRSEMSRSSA